MDLCLEIFGFPTNPTTVEILPNAVYAFCYYEDGWINYAGSFQFVYGVFTGILNNESDRILSHAFFELNADGSPNKVIAHANIRSCPGINWFPPSPNRFGAGVYRDLVNVGVDEDSGKSLVPPLVWEGF